MTTKAVGRPRLKLGPTFSLQLLERQEAAIERERKRGGYTMTKSQLIRAWLDEYLGKTQKSP